MTCSVMLLRAGRVLPAGLAVLLWRAVLWLLLLWPPVLEPCMLQVRGGRRQWGGGEPGETSLVGWRLVKPLGGGICVHDTALSAYQQPLLFSFPSTCTYAWQVM